MSFCREQNTPCNVIRIFPITDYGNAINLRLRWTILSRVAVRSFFQPSCGPRLRTRLAMDDLDPRLASSNLSRGKSVPRGNRPKIKIIHPLVIMGRQSFFKKSDSLAYSLV